MLSNLENCLALELSQNTNQIRPDHSHTKPKISILTEIKTSEKVNKALLRQTYLFSCIVDADLIVNFESLTEPLNQ